MASAQVNWWDNTWKILLFLLAHFISYSEAQGNAMLCTSPMAKANRIFITDIPESVPVGKVLSHLSIIGSNRHIEIQVTIQNEHLTFDPVSRNLTLVKKLDREKQESISIELGCTIKARMQTIKIPVQILITDVNDNPPIFQRSQYFANISELAPVGTTIISGVVATDKDIDNWVVTYEVMDGPYSSYFGIPIPARGDIVLKKPLDYESIQTMKIKVMAKDNHVNVPGQQQPQMNTTTFVMVRILDGDDRNPSFPNAPYMATIEENAGLNTVVPVSPKIQAFDQDTGINVSVKYSIAPDPLNHEDEYFAIEPVNAKVRLKKVPLVRGKHFNLLIKATQTDNADRYSVTSLRVLVQATNENAPKFLQKYYVARLVENTPVGSPVISVSAIDNDVDLSTAKASTLKAAQSTKGAILQYSFVDGQNAEDFHIDTKTGLITTKRYLDFETRKVYNITVQVSDGKYSSQAVVTVYILNENDNNPVFSQAVYLFDGKKEQKYVVGQVQAMDPDPGTVLSYRLLENNTLFSINANGVISISGDLHQITLQQVKILVIVEDDGTPPRQACAAVRVNFDLANVGAVIGGTRQMDLVIIIILAVVAAILLLVIILLVFYIYKKIARGLLGERLDRSYQNFKDEELYIQSFESRLNIPKHSPPAFPDPKGLTYTQKDRTAALNSHLQIYNDINIEDEGTNPAENPFESDNAGYTYSYGDQDINDNTDKMCSKSISHNGEMNGINEIEFDTALAPLDHLETSHSDVTNGSTHSSLASGAGSMRSRHSGSLQKLVASMSSSKPSVSFIDDHHVQVYNPQNAIDPDVSVVTHIEEKPGITVYY